MPIGQLIPELALLLTAVAVLVLAMWIDQRRHWICSITLLMGLAVAAVATAAQLDGPAHLTFQGVWAIDGFTGWAKLIILTASALTVVLSPEWLATDRRHGEYYAVLAFATLGALMMAAAADTMQLVVGVLLSSVTGYTLAAYHRGWRASVEAGMKFFLIGAMTNSVLLIGVTWLFGLATSTDYQTMSGQLAAAGPSAGWLAASGLVVVGLAFKLGAVPAHAWMPDVAEGAPAPAAAFLTVVPKIGAAAALARLGHVFSDQLPSWHLLIALVAVATMTLGNLAALRQQDLRRLLGWSSVSQSGYALVGVALVGASDGAPAALLYFLAAYAAANLAAFAAVTELRGLTVLSDYRGLATARPAIAAVLAASLLSLVGIPPLAGFVGKTLLMLEAVHAGYTWLAVTIVANSVISLYYYLRVIGPLYFDRAPKHVYVLGRLAAVALWSTGVLVVALGVAAGPVLRLLEGVDLLPQ